MRNKEIAVQTLATEYMWTTIKISDPSSYDISRELLYGKR